MHIVQTLVFVLIFVSPIFPVLADETPGVSPVEPVDDVATAKELNRKGLVLLDAGDCAGALSFFASSRALVRSYANTRNSALCLDALGRKKEALAMFETLLADYSDKLETQERMVAENRIAELRTELTPLQPEPLRQPEPSSSASLPATISVVRSPEKPRSPGRWSIGGFVGYAGGASLGSDAETRASKACTSQCPMVNGVIAAGRVDYRLGAFFRVELIGGYLHLGSSFQRDVATTYGAADDLEVIYRLDQELAFSGPFGGLGLSARIPLNQRFSILGRFAVAGLSATVANEMSGNAIGTDTMKLDIKHQWTTLRSSSVLLMPEMAVEVALSKFSLGAGFAVWVSTLSGSSFGERRLLPIEPSKCTPGFEGAAACAPESRVTSGERSHGVFAVFVPQISLRHQFD